MNIIALQSQIFFKKVQKHLNFKLINYFLFFAWLSIIFSIGSNSFELIIDIINVYNELKNIKNLFKFTYLRSGVVIIIFFLIIYLLFKEKNNIKVKTKNNTKVILLEDYFVLLFFLYTISAIIGLIVSCQYPDNHLNIIQSICEGKQRKNFWFYLHFTICFLCIIFIYRLAVQTNIKKYIISYSILFFIIFANLIIVLNAKFEYGGLLISFLDIKIYMNSNGLGRMILIFLAFLQSIYFLNYFKSKNLKLILLFTQITMSVLLFSLEGKFNSLAFLVMSGIFIFYISMYKLKKKFLSILIIVVIPYCIYQSKLSLEKKFINEECKQQIDCKKMKDFNFNSNRLFDTTLIFFKKIDITVLLKNYKTSIPKNTFTIKNNEIFKNAKSFYLETRNAKWKYLINDVFERKAFLGNGFEYDRSILANFANKKNKEFKYSSSDYNINTDAANGLIYSALTAGIFGILLYGYSLFYLIVISVKHYQNKYRRDILTTFSFVCCGIVICRSFIESGFMSWNFDLLLLISSLIVIRSSLKRQN